MLLRVEILTCERIAAMLGRRSSESLNPFSATQHEIRVYVPANYRGEHPTCVHVQLDGLVFGMQTVFNNLIERHEIPPMIAIGIKPGTRSSPVVTLADALAQPETSDFEFDPPKIKGRLSKPRAAASTAQTAGPGTRHSS
jgi:hypothetical protein